MKSNLKNLSTIFVLFIFSIFGSKLFANDVIVDAEVVEIKEKGNLIYASGNVRVLDGSSIKIIGNEATYNKLNQEIEIIGNVNFFDNLKKFKSRSDKIIFERDKGFLSTFGNVKIEDQLNNYEITSEKIIYDKKNGILKSFDETQIYYNNKYNIVSSDISFNNNRKIFSSTKNTSIQDEFNNKF